MNVLCTGRMKHRISIPERNKRFLSSLQRPGQFWNPPRPAYSGFCFSLQHVMKAWKRVVEVHLCFVPNSALDWGGCSRPSTPIQWLTWGNFPWGKKVTAWMWPFAFMSCWGWERISYVVLLHYIPSRRVLNYVWGQFHLCFITAIFYPVSNPTYFPYISFKTLGLSICIVFYYKICICDMYGFIILY